MLERPQEILVGVEILKKALGVTQAIIGIEIVCKSVSLSAQFSVPDISLTSSPMTAVLPDSV
jgi:hypothetical protein